VKTTSREVYFWGGVVDTKNIASATNDHESFNILDGDHDRDEGKAIRGTMRRSSMTEKPLNIKTDNLSRTRTA